MPNQCVRCEQSTNDEFLWCQDPLCTVGETLSIFPPGDFIGNLRIERLLCVTQTAISYECTQGKTRLLVKVAREGFERVLESETRCLLESFQNNKLFPTIYTVSKSVPKEADGNFIRHEAVKGITRYFTLYRPIEGEFLRDLLLRNPEPSQLLIGWILSGIASTIRQIHLVTERVIVTLSPESILLSAPQKRETGDFPSLSLYDLGLLHPCDTVQEEVHLKSGGEHLRSIYVAPEAFISDGLITYKADIYSLGVVAMEMIMGVSISNTYKFRRGEVKPEAMILGLSKGMSQRLDINEKMRNHLLRALDTDPTKRPSIEELIGVFESSTAKSG